MVASRGTVALACDAALFEWIVGDQPQDLVAAKPKDMGRSTPGTTPRS
jgi:hypothetical protein